MTQNVFKIADSGKTIATISVCDVKNKLTDSGILKLFAPSVYNPTPERLSSRAMKYQVSDAIKVYAYAEAGEYQGIIVFEIKETEAAILDIAVRPESRGRGVGSRLIDFMLRQFRVRKVIAETDDDAVGFYKKYGFSVTDAKQTFDTRRYICVMEKAEIIT